MTERVFLHVGEPKCGTTFLQNVMWGNRSPLAHQSVHLPGLTEHDQFRATQDLRGAPQPKDDPAGSWAGEWDVLVEQALRVDGSAVISHEMLAGASPEQIDRALASLLPTELHVIVTVRDIASLLPAEWQETVKHQNTQRWQQWLDMIVHERTDARRIAWFWTVHDTVDLLQRWGGRLPPERVHVITVPHRGAPPNLLWDRFASVIRIDPNSVDTAVARPNSSLGLPEVEMLRHLNGRLRGEKALPQWFYAGHVKETLAHQVLAARPREAVLTLPAALDDWAVEVAEKQIAGLRAAGYDIVGDLEELRPAEITGRRWQTKDVTYKQLYDASLDALVGLLHERYEKATSRPSIRSLVSGRATDFPGAYRVRRFARDMAANHASVAWLRVVVWRIGEWSRRRKSR